jgi:hypothetical protein
MREPARSASRAAAWKPFPNPEDRYSSGIPDFDRLLGGGFQRGSFALFSTDGTVGTDDLDLVLFPTFLNFLYQSRGIIAVLPSRDSPHEFRARLTRFVTRRRFDSRVRVVDYVGEDEGPPYVVSIQSMRAEANRPTKAPKERRQDHSRMEAAERAAQGSRKRSFLEFNAFELLDTLVGGDQATRMILYGVKRARHVGNLVIGLLGPGLRCAAGVRRMADTEFELHRDDVGLIVRGIRPAFSSCVVTPDLHAGPPHAALVPRPS